MRVENSFLAVYSIVLDVYAAAHLLAVLIALPARAGLSIPLHCSYIRAILPLPENVDVVMGGPPCQGVSGFNLYRHSGNGLLPYVLQQALATRSCLTAILCLADPLGDNKNKQTMHFTQM